MARKNTYTYIRRCNSPFLEGVGRIFDFGGTFNHSDIPYVKELRNGRVPSFGNSGFESDTDAIREIWASVGEHLYYAIGEFEEENRLSSVD